MDLAAIQAQINQGYGTLAALIGEACTQYRAVSAHNPLSPSNVVATLNVRFDAKPDFGATQVALYTQPVWYAAFDRTNAKLGDYLATANGRTFFINSMEDLTPTAVVVCSTVLSFFRPGNDGSYAYNGNWANNSLGQPLAQNWPCAMLQGTKGEKTVAELPQDTRAAWYEVFLPSVPGVLIKTTDNAIDPAGNRFEISSVELTNFGYRLTVAYSGA